MSEDPSNVSDGRLFPLLEPVPGLARDAAAEGPLMPVCNRWHCLGTPQCLCGQGELSDDPLWVESD